MIGNKKRAEKILADDLKPVDKMDSKYNLDIVELGKRVAIVREQILLLTQRELASILNTEQTTLSRLELGKGSSIYLIMDFVSIVHNKGFRGHMLFREPFNIDLFSTNMPETEKNKLLANIKDLKKQSDEMYKILVSLKKNNI